VAKVEEAHREEPPLPVRNDHVGAERLDLLGRFTATPLTIDLKLMQRTVRVETNSRALLELTEQVFKVHQHGDTGKPAFRWRIVCESDPQVQSTDVPLAGFSDLNLRYVNVGQRSFLAVDLENREAVAFLDDRFVEGEARLRHRPPLDLLFCMTAATLGLTTLTAGCAGVNDRGVLVFGPPNSGKTTASYLAARLGMEFLADQVVFLDMSGKALRVWGDPFPAVFRPEAVEFLPELRDSAHYSTYEDHSFYYFDKDAMQAPRAHPVIPACSVFLHRGAAHQPKLTRVLREEAVARLRDCMLFSEDDRFAGQIEDAIDALVEHPVYDLKYPEDPRVAAKVISEMLR
jgi:hypothetical protein